VESKGDVIPRGYPPGTVIYHQKPSVKKVLSGLPEFAFGAWFAAMWLSPDGFTARTIGLAYQSMAVELLLVHAATLFTWQTMSTKRREHWKVIAWFAAFYTAFGIALSLAFRSPTPMVIVVTFAITRTWASIAEPPPAEFAQRLWYNQTGMNIGLYFLLALVTAFVPLPFAGGSLTSVVEPMLWFDGWDWVVERLVFMASAFYLIRGFAVMWPWPRRLYLLPAPAEMK
jgi:hypothetical protein